MASYRHRTCSSTMLTMSLMSLTPASVATSSTTPLSSSSYTVSLLRLPSASSLLTLSDEDAAMFTTSHDVTLRSAGSTNCGFPAYESEVPDEDGCADAAGADAGGEFAYETAFLAFFSAKECAPGATLTLCTSAADAATFEVDAACARCCACTAASLVDRLAAVDDPFAPSLLLRLAAIASPRSRRLADASEDVFCPCCVALLPCVACEAMFAFHEDMEANIALGGYWRSSSS
mmetsp:Transcript_7729/g.17537  ORF Transcript_7729/g.17537 Transcript_7729/m.17537 type:complete len:233 (+) Transcript_7729:336-1034(+)